MWFVLVCSIAIYSIAHAADSDERGSKIQYQVLQWIDAVADSTERHDEGGTAPTLSVYLYLDSENSIDDLPDYVVPEASSYNIVVAFLTAEQIINAASLDIVTKITLPERPSTNTNDTPEPDNDNTGTRGSEPDLLQTMRELDELDAKIRLLEDSITGISNQTLSLSSVVLHITSQLAILQELLATIERFVMQDGASPAVQDLRTGLLPIANSTHDNSYIEILNLKQTYNRGDIISVNLYVDSPHPAVLDYGLFLVAGSVHDNVNYTPDDSGDSGYFGMLFGDSVFAGDGPGFYGPGFYCNDSGGALELKFERGTDLIHHAYNDWSDEPGMQGIQCTVSANAVHTLHFSITPDYPPRQDYSFVVATAPDKGFSTVTFGIS